MREIAQKWKVEILVVNKEWKVHYWFINDQGFWKDPIDLRKSKEVQTKFLHVRIVQVVNNII